MISEKEILSRIEPLVPQTFNLVKELAFKSALHGYRFDAVLVKDGRLIAGIEVSVNIESPIIKNKKARLDVCCKAKNIPYSIVTDGQNAIFSDLRKEGDRHEVDIRKALSILANQYEEVKIGDEQKQSLYTRVKSESSKSHISLQTLKEKDFLKGAKTLANGETQLSFDGETALLKALLGAVTEGEICRYTSINSLRRVLDNGEASVCSIVGMNDKSECYYFDNYVKDESVFDFTQQSQKHIAELNSNFIMSCSDISRLDKLTMWRMYGDDAKGVCLVYSVGNLGDDFILAPVSYAEENGTHPKLDFLKHLQDDLHIVFSRIDVWKHFFKPYEYADEKEIRLLYKDTNTSHYRWIQATGNVLCPIVEFPILKGANQFPLVLKEVWLGPKCAEKDVNRSQLEMYANLLDIKYKDGKLEVKTSRIDNYR